MESCAGRHRTAGRSKTVSIVADCQGLVEHTVLTVPATSARLPELSLRHEVSCAGNPWKRHGQCKTPEIRRPPMHASRRNETRGDSSRCDRRCDNGKQCHKARVAGIGRVRSKLARNLRSLSFAPQCVPKTRQDAVHRPNVRARRGDSDAVSDRVKLWLAAFGVMRVADVLRDGICTPSCVVVVLKRSLGRPRQKPGGTDLADMDDRIVSP